MENLKGLIRYYKPIMVSKPAMGIPIGHEEFNTQTTRDSLKNIQGFRCVQLNGQRTWIGTTLKPSVGHKTPPLSCEIFIGKIPHNILEDELIPLFSKAGHLYEFRLLMQFDGSNRGYAFARYTTIQEAKRAIQMFDNYRIRPKKFLGIMFAIQNTTLYIPYVPNYIPNREINQFIIEKSTGVTQLNINYGSDRKMVTVVYGSHRDATLARKQIMSAALLEWRIYLRIDLQGPPGNRNSSRKYGRRF